MQTEMDALVAAYESPTGTFDTAKAEDTLMRAQARLEELQLDWLPDVMSEVLARVDSRLDDSGLSGDPATLTDTDPDRPIIDAYATVHRVCKGWVDSAEHTRRGEQRLDRPHGRRRRRLAESRRLGHGDQLSCARGARRQRRRSTASWTGQ